MSIFNHLKLSFATTTHNLKLANVLQPKIVIVA